MLFRSELKREKAVPGEIKRMIDAVQRRLQDAEHEDIHPETRLEQDSSQVYRSADFPVVASDAVLGARIASFTASNGNVLQLTDVR